MNDLVAARVAAGYLRADAENNFCVAIDELHEIGCLERNEVVGIIRAGKFGNVAGGILPFASLNEMPGAGKRRLEPAVVVAVGRAASVIKVQVRENDPIEIFRADADLSQVFYQRCSI